MRNRPDCVLADRAYSSPSTRRALRVVRGIRFVGLEKKDHAAHRPRKGSRGGRPPAFDPEAYKGRNVVERCLSRARSQPVATRDLDDLSGDPARLVGGEEDHRVRDVLG